MDSRIAGLDTAEKCDNFAANAERLDRNDLAIQARNRKLEIKAELYGAKTQAEKEALQAVYAYEEILSAKNGKRTRATRTWQMIRKYGIIEAVERAVDRPVETMGYTALVDKGLERHAFEAVIIRHPELFSDSALTVSQKRITSWKAGK
ncbi:MAG: hypothetical protein JKX72_04215 [Robiginitomaculum sp.]|nr:hypothetical protein [Robiginitomaculum sp.]